MRSGPCNDVERPLHPDTATNAQRPAPWGAGRCTWMCRPGLMT